MKYFISSLGFWSKNVTSILNKNILLLKKNIDGKTCKNISEAVNKLYLSAHLGHSCETGCNKHDSSYYSKQSSPRFIPG